MTLTNYIISCLTFSLLIYIPIHWKLPYNHTSHQPNRFEVGKEGSHLANDSKDGRSIANRLESELKKNEDEVHNSDPNIPDKDQNPTDLAKAHGNKPSKGAMIDEQIKLEEEAEVSSTI